jgi:YfiH family protein
VRVRQVHSPDVVTVSDPWDEADRPAADALVTSQSGILLGIVTGDCAPVLLADVQAGIIGAAHAGWRGAARGVIGNTVGAMAALGADPSRIVAAVGPSIAQGSYEVGEDMRAAFDPADGRFFSAGAPAHWQFDLPGYVAAKLSDAGVTQVEVLARDTYAEEQTFFSFRRATHRSEPTDGRQVSVIGMMRKASVAVP